MTLTIQTLWARVNLGVIAMKMYSTFSKTPELKPHYQMQLSVISKTLVGGGLTDVDDVLYSLDRLGGVMEEMGKYIHIYTNNIQSDMSVFSTF